MSDDDQDSMSTRFVQIRTDVGLNRKSFADALGIAATVVSDIESAKREPSKSVLIKLSETYGVNLHWMLTGEKPEYRMGWVKGVSLAGVGIPLPAGIHDRIMEWARALPPNTPAEIVGEFIQLERRAWEREERGDHVEPAPPASGDIHKSARAPRQIGLPSQEYSMVKFRRGVPMELDPNENDPNGVVLLPLFNQRSAAGPGQEVLETAEVETLVPVVREILGHRSPHDCGVVRVVGDSMAEIQLNNGDRAIFDRGDVDGDGVFVITHNGAVRIKRLQYRFDVKRVFIKSENRRYPDVEEEPLEAIGSTLRIEGKVIGWLHRHLY